MPAAANLLRGRGAQARQHPGEAGVLRSLRTSFALSGRPRASFLRLISCNKFHAHAGAAGWPRVAVAEDNTSSIQNFL